jgi:hypothetical protein
MKLGLFWSQKPRKQGSVKLDLFRVQSLRNKGPVQLDLFRSKKKKKKTSYGKKNQQISATAPNIIKCQQPQLFGNQSNNSGMQTNNYLVYLYTFVLTDFRGPALTKNHTGRQPPQKIIQGEILR